MQHYEKLVALLLIMLPYSIFSQTYDECVAEGADFIGGIVYQDFNANGALDDNAGYADGREAGVTVVVYDDSGTKLGQTTTDEEGGWGFELEDGELARVEFVLPDYLQPAGASGGNWNSNIVVVESPICNIHFGVHRPGVDYWGDIDSTVAVNCYVYGDNVNGPNAADGAVVKFPYDGSTTPSYLAKAEDVGTTFGLTYHSSTNAIFVSSFMRRHSGFGPDEAGTGLTSGGIYRIDLAEDTVGLFIDLNDTDYFGANWAGTDPHPTSGLSADWQRDSASYDLVGKMALGDLELSEDGETLYTINLHTKQLVRIPVGASATQPLSSAISLYSLLPSDTGTDIVLSDCPESDQRPFALKFRNGKLYIGITCSGESDPSDPSLMSGHVFEFNPTTESFTRVLNFDFDNRDCTISGVYDDLRWHNWGTDYDDLIASWANYPNQMYMESPMPWLTNIEFDDEKMILGIRDRLGDMVGNGVYHPLTTDTDTLYRGFAIGDIMRACSDGSGNWNLEGTTAGCPHVNASTTGGCPHGEFYVDDNHFHDVGATSEHVAETAMGGLAIIPGSKEVLCTVVDPNDAAYAENGLRYFSNVDGSENTSYLVFGTGSSGQTWWGKSSGLGDIEILRNASAPPLEIVQRIWNDANGNGVQDADEAGISGVVVNLYDAGGTVIGTATSNSNGEIFFNESNVDQNGNTTFEGGTDALQANTSYFIALANTAQWSSGRLNIAATDYGVVTLTYNGEGDNPTNNDNDAITASAGYTGVAAIDNNGLPYAAITLGAMGYNEQTKDFGFSTSPQYASLGNYAWDDSNSNGIQDVGENGINSISIDLKGAGFDGLFGTVDDVTASASTMNDGAVPSSDGIFLFDNLHPGKYIMTYTRPTGYTVTAKNQTTDNLDSDIDPITLATDTITLTTGQVNTSVDAGFDIKSVIGDFIWEDDGDGIQEFGEAGLENVTISLYTSTDVFVKSVQSDDKGKYAITNISTGSYYLEVTPPAGFIPTTKNGGSDTDLDSDVDNTGVTSTVTLTSTTFNRSFDIGLRASALPVELLSFGIEKVDGCDVTLLWATAVEEDLAAFYLESSTDGRRFKDVGNQNPKGSNSTYRLKHQAPEKEIVYYRLRTEDWDGTLQYSKIISAELLCNKTEYPITVFPNPIEADAKYLQIRYYSPTSLATLKLFDAFGQEIAAYPQYDGEEGWNSTTLNIQNLPKGTYTLVYNEQVARFVKL